MRTLILSDFHLGSPASRCPQQLGAIEKLCKQYDRVIVNGDALDRYEAADCEPDAERWRERVLNACRPKQHAPELLTGNHDPAISKQQWVYLERSATLVFHGDCILDYTHKSKPEDQELARHLGAVWKSMNGRPEKFLDLIDVYRREQGAHLRANPSYKEHKTTLQYLIKIMIPPRKPFDVLHYWHKAPARAAGLARTFSQPVRHVVIGHTHRAGAWKVDGINVFNTGSFMPMSRPKMVEEIDGELRFQPIERAL